MASWDDVTRIAQALPETAVTGVAPGRSWTVAGKSIAWERPLSAKQLKEQQELGLPIPLGDVLAIHTPDVMTALAYVQMEPDKYFTIPHFKGYPAVLTNLGNLNDTDLRELLSEAWLVKAPKKLIGRHPNIAQSL